MRNATAIWLIAISASTLFLLTSCKTSPPSQPAQGEATSAVDLFNGRDFDGWSFCMKNDARPSRTWSVSDGVMRCTGQPYGYARTTQAYHDYSLTVVWRFLKVAPHANDWGIFVHIQPPDRVWPVCVQDQGLYHHLGDLILMGASADGCQPTDKKSVTIPQMGPPNENAVGEWNTNVIVCNGNAIGVFINGKSMNLITGCSLSSGYIGIQSEGGDIEIRKLSLQPLQTTPPAN